MQPRVKTNACKNVGEPAEQHHHQHPLQRQVHVHNNSHSHFSSVNFTSDAPLCMACFQRFTANSLLTAAGELFILQLPHKMCVWWWWWCAHGMAEGLQRVACCSLRVIPLQQQLYYCSAVSIVLRL